MPFCKKITKFAVHSLQIMRIKYFIITLFVFSYTFLTAGNKLPLDSVLNLAMNAAETYSTVVESYESDVYMRTFVETKKKNFLYKYTYLVPHFVLHDRKNDKAMIESVSKLRFSPPNNYYQDINYVNGSITKGNDIAMLPFKFISIDVYEESSPEESFFLPLRKNTEKYYKYELESIRTDTTKILYTINYTPLYKNPKLLKGRFVLEDKTWRVLQFYGEGDDWFVNFAFEIRMGNDKTNQYLPVEFKINQMSSYLGNKVENHYVAKLNYQKVTLSNNLSIKLKYNLGNKYRVRFDSVPLNNDSAFWSKKRSIPLEERDKEVMKNYWERTKIEEIENIQNDSSFISSGIGMKLAKNVVMNTRYKFKSTNFNYSGIFNPSMIGYSSQDGLTYRQKFNLSIDLKKNQKININTFAGYVFEKKKLFVDVSAKWNYEPAKLGYLSLSIGKDNQSYSSLFADMVQDSIKNGNLSFQKIKLNYYKDYYLRLFNSIELTNGFQFGFGFDYHVRKSDKSLLPSSGDMFNTRYNFVPVISLNWTPEQYYRTDGLQKVYVRSDYPTFKVIYAQSMRNFMGSTSRYNRFELDINQNIRFDLLKSFQYHVGSGFFTHQKTEYFADFVYFAKRYFPETWEDEIGGVFNELPLHLYYASTSYVQAHLMYETPSFLLSRISKLSTVVARERVYYSQLYTPGIVSYSEIGYGIGNRFFNAAMFASFYKLRYQQLGIKMVFKF